jgi:hypothetical protein
MDTLSAVKLAYRKHVLNDDSIGWDELGNCLLDAICNELGDSGYQAWLSSITAIQADPGKQCECGLREEGCSN